MFTRSKKRKLQHLDDLVPPKKASGKKHPLNPPPSKTPQKNKGLPLQSPSKYPPLTTINPVDISDSHTQTTTSLEDDWIDIENIINRPISPKPINNSEQYGNLSPIDEDDWTDLSNFINETTLSPDNIDFNNLEQYENLAPIDEDDWTDLSNFINETTLSPDNIDFNNLEQYENLAPIDQQDLDEILKTPSIQIPTPILNTPPIKHIDNITHQNLPIYSTVFTAEQLIRLSSIVDGVNLDDTNKFNLYTEQTTQDNPSTSTQDLSSFHAPSNSESDKQDQDEDGSITSDEIFTFIMHLVDCKVSITKIDKNTDIIKKTDEKIRRLLYHQINLYNLTIDNINIPPPENPSQQIVNRLRRTYGGYISALRLAIIIMCDNLQTTYPKIYPTRQILSTIQSNYSQLRCLAILENEKELKIELTKYKDQIEVQTRNTVRTDACKRARVNRLRQIILNIENKYKLIHTLE